MKRTRSSLRSPKTKDESKGQSIRKLKVKPVLSVPPVASVDRMYRAVESFGQSLDLARQLWRLYPSLVEAKEIPEPFKGLLEEQYGKDGLKNGYSEGLIAGEDVLLEEQIISRSARKTLTLHEIRRLYATEKHTFNVAQKIVSSFTTADSDAEEIEALGRFKAIYRQAREKGQAAAPAEYILREFVEHACIRFMELDYFEKLMAEFKWYWEEREAVRDALREDEVITGLRNEQGGK